MSENSLKVAKVQIYGAPCTWYPVRGTGGLEGDAGKTRSRPRPPDTVTVRESGQKLDTWAEHPIT